MGTIHEVHWHEGLFLQPHHLQTMQRFFLDRFTLERRFGWAYPYGVVESRLSADALENMLVKFDRLTVVMPSGLVVSIPDNADLPTLDIKEAFEAGQEAFTVFLGVPLWFAERANVIANRTEDDWRVKRLYRPAEADRLDENTGENRQAVATRRINVRLMLKGEDPSDMELIPLLRVTHATGDEVGMPRLDPKFIPPCLTLGGSPVLRDLVRDLANQVEASRKELSLQITRGGFHVDTLRGIQFEQLLRLRTLNHFAGRLLPMVEVPGMAPFDLYLELRGLLGELAALYPDRDQYDVAKYDHDAVALPFFELATKIRALLRGAVAPSFIKVPFVPEGNTLVAALSDEHLSRANEYFLGVKTKEDPKVVAHLVEDPDEFKLMAKSLALKAIFGVRLALERIPPLELPSETGLIYFRLLRAESARMWERVAEEKSLSARWPGLDTSDFKLTLYMTVPSMEGKV
jgi:type VI secretion system ImpJ/VasE family protein